MGDQVEQLRRLRQQYYSLYPLHRLRLPDPDILARNQPFLKNYIVADPILGRHQPDAGYQKTFWRRVVAALEDGVGRLTAEDSDIEVDETFYELMADLMVSQSVADPSTSYRTFIYDSPTWSPFGTAENAITLVEELAAIQAGTTGLRTWTAALHLAQHIIEKPSLLGSAAGQGQLPPILELGAGTGFLSILLGQLGADVTATDLGGGKDMELDSVRRTPLVRLQENVDLNRLDQPPRVLELDWTEAEADDRPSIWSTLSTERRTIVGADIIYDPDLVPPLVSALHALLVPTHESKAVVAATVRNQSTLELFVETCRKRELTIDQLNLTPVDDECPMFWDSALEGRSEVRIYEIRRPNTALD